MKSDLAAARFHLESAFECLFGDDEFSRQARDAVSLMIDAITTIEHRKQSADVIPFCARARAGRSLSSGKA